MSALTAVLLVFIMLLFPALADVASYSRARAGAQTAADSAALAAAQEIVIGGSPAGAASDFAAINGASVSSVKVAERWVVVAVEKDCDLTLIDRLGIKVGPVRASGKAELKEIDDIDY